jgi:hypothetical protein
MGRLGRWAAELGSTFGWVAGSLLFSAFSIAVVIGFAWLVRLAFPWAPAFTVVFALLGGFVLYLFAVGWIAWKILKRRLNIQ